MTRNKKDWGIPNRRDMTERLDRLGSDVLRAFSLNEAEAEEAVSSPFLYARIRSRIAGELSGREEKENWLSMFFVFWRAVPAMALVAVFSLVLFLSSNSGGLAPVGLTEDGLPSVPDSEVESVVFAESQPLSNDEILATILGREDGEAAR